MKKVCLMPPKNYVLSLIGKVCLNGGMSYRGLTVYLFPMIMIGAPF